MSGYSRVNLLGKQGIWVQNKKRGFWDMVIDFLDSFSSTVSLTITVPTAIYLRTKLLCEYISEEVDVDFDIANFLMLLYLDFINSSIKKYEPLKMYRSINPIYQQNETLKITQGKKVLAEYKRNNESKTSLFITMDKKDAVKGEMILYELDELYGHNLKLEQMMGNLWINFIEEYKRGDNQKALNTIIKMLKIQKRDEAD